MRKTSHRENFRGAAAAALFAAAVLAAGCMTNAYPALADASGVMTQAVSENSEEQPKLTESGVVRSDSQKDTEITGADIEDGSYPVETEVISGELQFSETSLTAEKGKLTLHLTLKDGTTQDVGINALDDTEKVGTAEIRVVSSSLPKGAVKTEASKAYQPLDLKKVPLETGTWEVSVSMEGGSGRASVKSPCTLTVDKEGMATAEIEWSSSHYDYMIVGGKKYTPVNHPESSAAEDTDTAQTEENSRFEIPVAALDEPETVIGDTTAMSRPYEIEYTLTFSGKSARKKENGGNSSGITVAEQVGGIAAAVIVAALAVLSVKHLRERRRKNE